VLNDVQSFNTTRRCPSYKTSLDPPFDEPASSSSTMSLCFIIDSRALDVFSTQANIDAVPSILKADRRQHNRSPLAHQATCALLFPACWTQGRLWSVRRSGYANMTKHGSCVLLSPFSNRITSRMESLVNFVCSSMCRSMSARAGCNLFLKSMFYPAP
jgi:hypothetical protein